jgi:hypothetical protein
MAAPSAIRRRASPRLVAPLQGHDRHGPGLLGDPGLVGGDDVHDDAALEHLGEAALDPRGAGDLVAGLHAGELLGCLRDSTRVATFCLLRGIV